MAYHRFLRLGCKDTKRQEIKNSPRSMPSCFYIGMTSHWSQIEWNSTKHQRTEKAWIPFELGIRNNDNWPNLAIEHLFGVQKSVRNYRKIQKWKTGSFTYTKSRGRKKNENLFKRLTETQLEMWPNSERGDISMNGAVPGDFGDWEDQSWALQLNVYEQKLQWPRQPTS